MLGFSSMPWVTFRAAVRQEEGREDVLTRAQRRTRPQPGSRCVSPSRGILALKFLLPCSHPAGTSSPFLSCVQEKGQCRAIAYVHTPTHVWKAAPSRWQEVMSAHTHYRLCAWDLATLYCYTRGTQLTHVCVCALLPHGPAPL